MGGLGFRRRRHLSYTLWIRDGEREDMAETILSYLLAAELEQAKAMTTVQPRRIESNAQCPKCGKPYGSATSCRMNPCGM